MTIDSRGLVSAAIAIGLALLLVVMTDPRRARGREAERRLPPVYVRAGGAIDAAAGITIRNDTRRPVWVSWEVIEPGPSGSLELQPVWSNVPAWGVP